MNHAHLTTLLAFQVNLKVAHWQADTRTNDHRALGDLYDIWDEKIDELAELTLGKDGNQDFPTGETVSITPQADVRALLKEGANVLTSMRNELTPGADDDSLNLIADLSAALNKTRYLLNFGIEPATV